MGKGQGLQELILKIGERLGDREGKIQLFVMCEKDWRQRLEIIQEEEEEEEENGEWRMENREGENRE